MKDEGPTVVEWVAHHLAVGFTEVMVYTNDCTDGTDDLLK
ncbi:MAG: glycosyltransferase family 2 protein, partial [Tabrizicola sp.]